MWRVQKFYLGETKINQLDIYVVLEVWGASGPQLLAEGYFNSSQNFLFGDELKVNLADW